MESKAKFSELEKNLYLCQDKNPSSQEINTLASLFNEGRYPEAANLAKALTVHYPLHGFGWKVLGAVLKQMGRIEDALTTMRKAVTLSPSDAEAYNNLGAALIGLGRHGDALASYRRALEIKPNYAEVYSNLGNALRDLGRHDDAVASYRRALEIKPNYAEAYNNLGAALIDLGRHGDAVASYRLALEIKPNYAEAYSNLGNTLRDLGRHDDAVASYRRALEIKPDYAEVYSNLGNALQDLGRHDDAVASYRRALEIKPDYATAHSNLGNVLRDLGRHDDAVASYRRALEIKPDYATAHSNLLFSLTHNSTVDAETLYFEHCQFGKRFEAYFRVNCPQHINSRDTERSLRIGFVSGDLRAHPVINLFEPILAHLSSYPQLSLYAYSNHAIEDAVTQRIREYFRQWQVIEKLSDTALDERIRSDEIDILIDLSGHTAKNRLLAFARKPAPVQASWIGYPGTTGLRSMDYYLADHFFLPHEEFRTRFIEKIVYLPATATFLPSKAAPPVNDLPALNNGYVTFGSFNRLDKLSPPVIASWSQLLRALPESRMLICAVPQDGHDILIYWFAQEGITRDRLDFHPRCGMSAYLTLYHEVDICLDAFPYNGATTSGHGLWMGVPTLTMAGSTPSSRAGVAFLSHVGLEALVAHDIADFVKKGLALAKDVEALAMMRMNLRSRCEQSPLCQPELTADALQRAFRIMWQRWCNNLPTEAFDVSNIIF